MFLGCTAKAVDIDIMDVKSKHFLVIQKQETLYALDVTTEIDTGDVNKAVSIGKCLCGKFATKEEYDVIRARR